MRSTAVLAVLMLATVPLVGCLSGPQGPPPPEGQIPFETVDQGDDSAIEQRGTITIRSQAGWAALWENHTADQSPTPERPTVDFSERMVLAAFKGTSSNGCHGAEITSVTGQADGSILVEGAFYEVTGMACTEQITHPFHIVTIEAYGGEVTYAMSEEERPADDGDDPGPGDQGSYTCRKQSERTGEEVPPSDDAFETLDEGPQSGIEEVCLTFARNQTAWEALWTAHQSRTSEPDERPEVDFSSRMVVAIFKGQSPDGCHRAEIENLTTDGDALVVHGAFFEIEGAFCTEAITYPFHIVETDRHEGPIRFDVRNETRQA